MPEPKLNWSSAEVKDAELAVALDGDLPKGWKQSFMTTVRLLGEGEWGEVTLKKGTVHVHDVEPGTEDKLRHHLESVVEQANSSHPAEEDESEAADSTAGNGPDAEMTDEFRSFADR